MREREVWEGLIPFPVHLFGPVVETRGRTQPGPGRVASPGPSTRGVHVKRERLLLGGLWETAAICVAPTPVIMQNCLCEVAMETWMGL